MKRRNAMVLALCLGLTGAAWAQQDRDHDQDRGRAWWNLQQGRNDYGYGHGPWGYGNGRYDRYGHNQASQFGYQDGLNDGRHDSFARHKFRPEKARNYKHGDRGYNSRFGDKNRYRDAYREAYLRGYRQGFGQRYRR